MRIELEIIYDQAGLLGSVNIEPRFAVLHLDLVPGPTPRLQIHVRLILLGRLQTRASEVKIRIRTVLGGIIPPDLIVCSTVSGPEVNVLVAPICLYPKSDANKPTSRSRCTSAGRPANEETLDKIGFDLPDVFLTGMVTLPRRMSPSPAEPSHHAALVRPTAATGATIVVTDLTQKISDSCGCSLPEAIYAANFDRNIAIDSTDPDHFVVTHCTPGNGDDTIVLPANAVFQMSGIIADAYNAYGPTATPIIFSNIDIEANGSTFQRTSTTENYRAFTVGNASIDVPALGGTAKTISGTGQLKIDNAYIKNFKARGGNGASGGGGGMGAGGAIYFQSGQLTILNSTFENNSALGGNGSDEVTSFPEPGGGGGGLGGNGGPAVGGQGGEEEGSGGGGGGSRGNGGATTSTTGGGGGGGGTYTDGGSNDGGFRCGGKGGFGDDPSDGSCPGGGGGGGRVPNIQTGLPFPIGGDGANGNYGGGGGGGGVLGSAIGEKGGKGGYGGGGGAGAHDGDAGNGGFGGGGAGGHQSGSGGLFAGNGTADNGHGANGGGGAGLGGAIFNESGTLMIFNSTFTANTAFGGAGGDSATSVTAAGGDGQGNAIFSLNGSTVMTHVTVSNNGGGANIADVVILANGVTAGLFLSNSILANNLGGGPNGKFVALNGGDLTQTNTGNLIEANGASDGSGKFTGVTTTLDPQLSALALNIPASTPTMAIGTGSPAYGTANLTKCQATDQRGVSRKPGCDIGAYERNEFKQTGNTYTVTNTSDHDDGTCGIIDCTLREAISAANQSTGAITINFAGNVTGTILLDRNFGSLFVGNLTVGPITINGPGAGVLAVSGNTNIKVFSFSAGASTVSGLTIRDGFPPSGSGTVIGGGMSVGSPATVTLNDCAFINNRLLASNGSSAGANGNIAQGGAIANSGTLTLNRCTFSNNEALGGNGFPNTGSPHFGGSGGAGQGGAVYNSPSGTLTVNNCTFSNNLALGGNGGNNPDFGGGNGGVGQGGAISSLGTMTLTASTLSGNTGTGGNAGTGSVPVNNGQPGKGSGGIAGGGNNTVRNSISAGNTGNHGGGVDADGTFTSGGYNLIGIRDGSSGFTVTGDQGGTAAAPLNAKLGPLANNGGPTQTLALLAGSPAIDKGLSNGLTTDQRGFARPSDDPSVPNALGGDGSDIGAFEIQAAPATPTPTPTPTPLVSNVQFSSGSYNVNEGNGFATITVARTGDTSGTVTVDYATSDIGAQQRTDYTITAGTVTFAPGIPSATFPVLIVDDLYIEGTEALNLTLSNPTGGTQLGSPSVATLTITDNDSSSAVTNPDDNARFFVQQHYYDFLSRYPDQSGWDFWTGQITQCGLDPTCLRNKRIDVSNSFFYELEYQQTGAYVFRLYRVAFGNNQPVANPDGSNQTEAKKLPSYSVFAPDRARVVGGTSLAQGQLDFANSFSQRSAFLARYPASQDGPTLVDAVLATIKNDTGSDLTSQRTALINLFNSDGRGAVLYRLADDNLGANPINNRTFIDEEYNRAFVFTEYAGYLRRDSDIGGFLFWLGQVNNAPLRDTIKQHAMVCSFITSAEYQGRFSSVTTHSNAECH
jgi:CSLREA domain-containing protein